ncbi:hypothetical protein NDU88_004878 [Pleurodeles waltl]|uniref:Uncharacterized protein n=1 Tax=Pleurodeles waltl TaxID=8319 RepID=A0AAV7PDS4_PLEWA|nr:hypothetical protein NDU88_004878 [Pleurodeles waltl]
MIQRRVIKRELSSHYHKAVCRKRSLFTVPQGCESVLSSVPQICTGDCQHSPTRLCYWEQPSQLNRFVRWGNCRHSATSLCVQDTKACRHSATGLCVQDTKACRHSATSLCVQDTKACRHSATSLCVQDTKACRHSATGLCVQDTKACRHSATSLCVQDTKACRHSATGLCEVYPHNIRCMCAQGAALKIARACMLNRAVHTLQPFSVNHMPVCKGAPQSTPSLCVEGAALELNHRIPESYRELSIQYCQSLVGRSCPHTGRGLCKMELFILSVPPV